MNVREFCTGAVAVELQGFSTGIELRWCVRFKQSHRFVNLKRWYLSILLEVDVG